MSAESGKAAASLYVPAEQQLLRAQLDQLRAKRVADLHANLARAAASFYATRSRPLPQTFSELPLLSGAELAAEIVDHPPFGRLQLVPQPPIRAGLATAGVPRPVPIFWTDADLSTDAHLGARALWRGGLRPRGRASDTLDGGLVTPGTLAIADALDRLDALAVPVGPITTAAALARAREVWVIVQPQMLIMDAATFRFLQKESGVPDAVRMVVLTPEDHDLLAAPPREDVYRIVSLPIVSTFLAGECTAHTGFHVPEDAIVAEIIDGKLVVTTLARSATIVRLDTGLHATLDPTPCPCGETHARLIQIHPQMRQPVARVTNSSRPTR